MTTKLKPFVIDLGGHQATQASECDLSVTFGSIGTGIDSGLRSQTESFLEKDASVREVQPYVIGREGEALLCIRLHDEGEIDRLFDDLRALASKGYMVRIRSKTAREFHGGRVRK